MTLPAAILATIAALAMAWLAWPLLLNLWAGYRRARIVEREPFSSPDDWGDR